VIRPYQAYQADSGGWTVIVHFRTLWPPGRPNGLVRQYRDLYCLVTQFWIFRHWAQHLQMSRISKKDCLHINSTVTVNCIIILVPIKRQVLAKIPPIWSLQIVQTTLDWKSRCNPRWSPIGECISIGIHSNGHWKRTAVPALVRHCEAESAKMSVVHSYRS
jgi:hypothetical protein